MPEKPTCQICGTTDPRRELIPAAIVRPSIIGEIRKARPDWREDGFICRRDLNEFRSRYIHNMLTEEKGELSQLEAEVYESLKQHELVASDVDEDFQQKLTVGQRMADKISDFGGSWKFISLFALVLAVWIGINGHAIMSRPFDPYPYILLNLILSCLAAIQAPVIMMSQNRQEARDRLRSQSDYRVNLKAELEIRQLHEKLDHLISRQWERLMEIQDIQTEIMSELAGPRHRT
ncbi:MAG TPA: DUF1003 domain-containing protein [Alphaproteobacteria bacterium]|nr:DUF1003 domain-containing protein [Alphaproteobacteria bacterium]